MRSVSVILALASLGCTMTTTTTTIAPTMTLAIVNARVWTGDASRPWADAVAVTGSHISAVGSSAAIRKLASEATRVIDAQGRMVVPGFIDSHVHFMSGGYGLTSVQLRDARTREEFIARIKEHASRLPQGAWMLEGNWDHQNWGGELPRRDWIDSVTPNTPVFIQRLDGHMTLANSAALRAAGVTRDTRDVEGGTVVRDPSGEPTGILKDNATSLVDHAIPDAQPVQEDAAADAAMAFLARQGVTSVVNMGTWHDLEIFERAQRAGRMRTRIYAVVPLASWERLRDTVATRGRGDEWLHIGGLKGFMDGSLGSHTARMFEPFTDAPNDLGLWVTPPDSIYAWARGADAAGLHVIIHAIGDRANRTLLDTYERIERENGERDRRFRIEHAQHLAPPEIPRFAKLGVIPSMQPYHAIDDGRWAERFLGPERIKGTYAFRSLRDAGARLAFGSDWFVAPPTPLEGIYAAVTRRTLDEANPGGWVPEEKITVEDALRAYTSGAAYAEFSEQQKGVIARGMLADLVIIDRDLTRIPPETIRDAHVVMTIVGGRVVFDVAAAASVR
ncbi:MAG TPA: amidohydrolase [Gemmatimonadaceae bacterium]|nr:amidohydrolase [Gemmatimonadaceae bacterium]